jgi:lipopolysaccharide transport system ATP-binding protein
MKPIIEVENLSKQYRLGSIGTGTVSHDLNRWWHRVRGKEDPYLKIGQTNDRTEKSSSDYVWSLKDVNFTVREGEVLGIIGKNGAGKSTLLKILSKVTAPTTGKVRMRGRVASLLEVGTGFNPELTGEENIFLNGAILGMTKKEIKSKFDEIVDFSGVEKYIDTPVKRYSSGMYVRLAFAVAAHLEPEILIVDEVLAVGDADFQKKCVGKMKDVSVNDGRTVLFVSHNLAAVKSLCTHGIILDKGMIDFDGGIDTAISRYLSGNTLNMSDGLIPDDYYRPYKFSKCKFTKLLLKNKRGEIASTFLLHETIFMEIEVEAFEDIKDVCISIAINSYDGQPIVFAESIYKLANLNLKSGTNRFSVTLQNKLLAGRFSISLGIAYAYNGRTLDYLERVFEFNTLNTSDIDYNYRWNENNGLIYLNSNWQIL